MSEKTSRGSRRKLTIFLVVAVVLIGSVLVALFESARYWTDKASPLIREKAEAYLEDRFDSDVDIGSLNVQLPIISPLHFLTTKGRGSIAQVEGRKIVLYYKGDRNRPPLFSVERVSFGVDLGTVFGESKEVPLVQLDGLTIQLPPKEERLQAQGKRHGMSGVVVNEVRVHNAKLLILPKNKEKKPLDFNIEDLHLWSVGASGPMRYEAVLTNPKPPGRIQTKGNFGPWQTESPSDSPISGEYVFSHADLGIFSGIAGILNSTGNFEGALNSITARGEARVPDFRLKGAGNPVPLSTKFEVLVDGTNGNTILQPVVAQLGSTTFTTSGAVIRKEGDLQRTIDLEVSMPNGDVRDVTRLAMKGPAFLAGRIVLKSRIRIPASSEKVREKLLLAGQFQIRQGKFLRASLQDQIDSFSRRGQGQPGNQEIDDVLFRMKGRFRMRDQILSLNDLGFDVPGAQVRLDGSYNLVSDSLDFHGVMKLQAKVSQTMTGWKRWALKPVDPFFEKQGAGTYLHIKAEGTASDPKFGLDRGGKSSEERESTNK